MSASGETYYVDTTPGAPTIFAPPEPVADYRAWLVDRYQACRMRDGDRTAYYGLAQRANAIARAAERGARIICLGPGAEQAARFLRGLCGEESAQRVEICQCTCHP